MSKGLPYSLANADLSKLADAIPVAAADASGTVKQAAAVADVASDATAATIATSFNALLSNLRTAGILASA